MSATITEQRKRIVQECLDSVWNAGDLTVVDEHFADDAVLHESSQPEKRLDPEGYKALIKEFRTAFPDIELRSIDDIIADGETVAIRYTWCGTHDGKLMGIAPTGKTVEATGMAFYQFEDEEVTEEWILDDLFGLMQQLGVIDSPAD